MRKILLTRDSVSIGDDARDNSLEIEVKEDWKIDKILDKVLEIKYLPQIMGGKATWSVAYYNPLAVVAQQWHKPKFIGSEKPQFPYSITNRYKDFDKLHFNYHDQEEPELVFNVISRFKTVF